MQHQALSNDRRPLSQSFACSGAENWKTVWPTVDLFRRNGNAGCCCSCCMFGCHVCGDGGGCILWFGFAPIPFVTTVPLVPFFELWFPQQIFVSSFGLVPWLRCGWFPMHACLQYELVPSTSIISSISLSTATSLSLPQLLIAQSIKLSLYFPWDLLLWKGFLAAALLR